MEIAHIFPRAISKRIQFETHHKRNRIQIANIDDKANLIALCSVCHYAFDLEEWTFLPDDMSAWIQAANAEPGKNFIPIWNSQRDIRYRPWRLALDPESQASQDKDFNSAFTNNPLKTWSGEVGALILSRSYLFSIDVENPTTGLVKALEEYRTLLSLWISYIGSCSVQQCLVCKRSGDKSGGDGNRSDKDREGNGNDTTKSSDDQEEDQSRENDENKGGEYLEENVKGDDGDMEYEDYEEDGEYEDNDEHEEDGEHEEDREYEEDEVVEGRRGNYQDKSSLYDTTVPYSFRKGYTWAGTTSNELMAMWQGLPYIKHPNGQITLTQPN